MLHLMAWTELASIIGRGYLYMAPSLLVYISKYAYMHNLVHAYGDNCNSREDLLVHVTEIEGVKRYAREAKWLVHCAASISWISDHLQQKLLGR
ncbi:hypothetical protein V6N13_036199 [Hibiscus sabdariffa]|uniref:Uncharacterized protein n=1 Tax=Hibiscus sabdariffa TaxID=183260 RepID=A0ABR2S7T8_9ROSI